MAERAVSLDLSRASGCFTVVPKCDETATIFFFNRCDERDVLSQNGNPLPQASATYKNHLIALVTATRYVYCDTIGM